MQAITDWSKDLRVEVRGDDVVGHAGNVIPRMLADATGLTEALSAAVSRPEVIHDRGAVLRDVAVAIASGSDCISDARVLRDQPRVFGAVASTPTMWRSLNEIDDAALALLAAARNQVREYVWEWIAARHGRIPPSRTCYGDLGETIVIRIDASLIDSHSDKERAAGTFKGGGGFIRCWRSATTPGNCWRSLRAPAARDRTRPSITSRSSTPRSPRSRRGGGATSWSPSTAPGPVTRWSST